MRLASLFSGGKDSVLSLYLAEQMGHDVPYIINIRPKEGSWMFHVPNQDLVPLLAEAMCKEMYQTGTEGTEADDMNALREVLKDIDIDGVILGAVMSDYQWERVNMICGDLDLKVICPLWRKDPMMILEEMIDSGIKATIAGVYAEGLSEEWLGRAIDRDAVAELKGLERRYGLSLIGEGGEYESLVTDSPMQSSVLVIERYEKHWKNQSGTLNVTEAHLEPKVNPF